MRIFMKTILTLGVCLLLLAGAMPIVQAQATVPQDQDWPQFRADSANTGTTAGIGPSVGQMLWIHETGPDPIVSSPTVADGKVFIGDNAGTVWALDEETGKVQWLFETNGAVESSPTYLNGTIYIGSMDMNLYALDASDGKEKWNFSTDGGIKSSVSIAEPWGPDGEKVLVFGSYDNNMYGLDTNGKELWRYTAASFIHGKPAVYDDLAFTCSCDNNIYAVDVTTGDKAWNTSINDYSGVSPSAVNGTLYTAGRGGTVHAVNITEGTPIWGYDSNGVIEGSPAVGDEAIFIGTIMGEMLALRMVDGNRTWLFRAPDKASILSSPALVGGVLYFGDRAGILHALQASDGKELWNFTADSAIESSPAVAYGKIFFATSTGKVYALADTKPVVQITSPAPWEKVRGRIDVYVYAFGTGLTSVEVSIDGKKWRPAERAASDSFKKGTWVRSMDTKDFRNGEHALMARATNATGVSEDSIYIVVKNKEETGFIPGFVPILVVAATCVVAFIIGYRYGVRRQRDRS
jgi:outer membrane protein assembly factor BamB